MNEPTALTSAVAILAALMGAALAVWGTARAARPQTPGQGLAWMALAGSGFVLLSLGAAVRAPSGDGLRAAALQGAAVLLAAALGALSLGKAQEGAGAGRASPAGKQLASVALFVAWLGLLGLPPAAGFHARILVCRSLLQAGWSGALAFALAVSAAGLIPAFSALSLGCPGSLRGGRAFLAVLLLIAILLVGVYPGFGLAAANLAAGLAR
jgi:NADH:ubiquinone oxidoreductase subunit 2 (subunit N)